MKHLSTQYFNGNQLKEVAAPTENTDAANKAYVDAAVSSAGDNDYVVEISIDANGETFTCDKSISNIYAAYIAGKNVSAKMDLGSIVNVSKWEIVFPLSTAVYIDNFHYIHFANYGYAFGSGTGVFAIEGQDSTGTDVWQFRSLFDEDDKNKLDTVDRNAEQNVQADWSESDTDSDSYIQHKPTIPTSLSQLTNDSITTPTQANQAATKAYVDAAVASAGGGGGGGMGGSFTILDDNNGNISLIFTPSVLTLTDDNNGNISLTIV
ncbi:MAG: hypothetical protein K5890_08560 [Bacteroidales bacterium]|nr:hypothetical protein [Bacteroidales bacterium]